MIWLCTALLGALSFWYISMPLWLHATNAAHENLAPLDQLSERRDNLLRQLKELEFDHTMGKIETDDYTRLRREVAAETATVLTRLEKLQVPAASINVSRNLEMESEIEVQIARSRRRLAAAKAQWHCAQCGRGMAESDKFCASCGTPCAAA